MAQTAEENCRLGRRQELTPAGNENAKVYFRRAIELDPDYLPAYAELSYALVRDYQNVWNGDREASLSEAEAWAEKAAALGDNASSAWHNDFRGRWYLAIVYWNQGHFDQSFTEFDVARNMIAGPDTERAARNRADLDADMAEAFIYKGDANQAIGLIEDAMAMHPAPPPWHMWNLGRAYYMAGRYQDAIDTINRMIPNDVRLITAASLARLGDVSAAQAVMTEFSTRDPNWSVAKSAEYRYGSDAARQHWLDGLRMAGLKEN